MSHLYVINKEKRNAPNCLTEELESNVAESSEFIKREHKSISVGRIKIIQDAKIREQEKLWDQLNARDSKKQALTKLAYGIFSLFLSALIAIISFTDEPRTLFMTREFMSLFTVVIIGMAMINFTIIMNIISLKHSRILFTRQINCLRYAIESCNYAIMMGRFPIDSKELRSQESYFYKTIGKHRKLPVNNDDFRDFHKKIFESADNLTIGVITALTICLAFLPLIYFWNTENSNTVGAFTAISALSFLGFILIIMIKARNAINNALDFEKTEIND